MAKSSNYSSSVDVDLNLKDIDSQLKSKKYGITLDTSGVKSAKDTIDKTAQSTKNLGDTTENVAVTYQQFRQVLDLATSALSNMYEQVRNLDSATTELKKVSDLQGASLDKYVSKLSKMGQTVGRTGKPNRSEPVCCDGKAAQRTAPKPLKASRALSLQHEDEKSLSVIINNELVRKQKDDKDDSMVEKPKESMINNVS